MDWVPSELQRVKADVEAGITSSATVRTLLAWYGQQRRGIHVVNDIRRSLRLLGLVTEPDFDSVWIDYPVEFRLAETQPVVSVPAVTTATVSLSDPSPDTETGVSAAEIPVRALEGQDPSYSVLKLDAANKPPVSVKPDTPIAVATNIMLLRKFSQLPVMSGERSVKGLFSWRSLGSALAFQRTCEKVSDAMEQVSIVSGETSIFLVAEMLSKDEVVLVQASRNDPRISGIVTTSDLTGQFSLLGEPFLLIGEIENRVRLLIDGNFTQPELSSAADPGDSSRVVDSVSSLTFGEYIRLLENPDNWSKCRLQCVDRATFIKNLNEVREIRNDVMHFDPDGIGPEALSKLREFAQFLDTITRLSRGD